MVNKFLIAIVAIIAAMVALVAMPGIGSQPTEQQDLNIEYSRQKLARTEDTRLIVASIEDLVIKNDRYAIYRNLTGLPDEKKFTISNEEMNGLKGLILTTGFMQVGATDYLQKDGLANVTKYTLKLESGGSFKTITWVNLEASEVSVPSIVRNIGTQLDAVIERHI